MTLYDKILWLLMGLIGLGLILTARSVEFPPMPEVKKVYRPAKGVTQGAGAAALIEPKGVVLPPLTNIVLAWNWTTNEGNPASNVVFLVRESRSSMRPSTNWPVIITTTQKLASVSINKTIKAAWFTVTASNTVTHKESGFATK